MQPPQDSASAAQFQRDIHRLRGVAILLIVATHCVTFFSWITHPVALKAAHDLFDNSSLIFMFISGYLFQHTSANFSYARYLKTKARNVLLPYVIAATPGIAYMLLCEPGKVHDLGLDGASTIERVAYLLVYGGAQPNYAMWFIPVLCLYYLAAPLLLRTFNRPAGPALLLVLVPLSVLMHRPSYAHGHNLMLAVYFLSAYATGMLSCKYRDGVVRVLDSHLPELLLTSMAIIVMHAVLSPHHGNYEVLSFRAFDRSDGWIDWLFIQKMAMTFALWGLMRRTANIRMPLVEYLATVSFTVYFLHVYVLQILGNVPRAAGAEASLITFFALLAAAIVLPAALATGIRRLAPHWSRPLIGS